MKNVLYIFFILSIYNHAFGQDKLYLFDINKKPITEFQVTYYIKDSVSIYKSLKNNQFYLNKGVTDSIKISYDSFYSQKIILSHLKNKDSIFLDKQIELKEVVITKQYKNYQLGANAKKKNIKKISNWGRIEEIIEIDVSNYHNAKIENINFYIFKNFSHSSYSKKKLSSNNKKIELVLFQSDFSPNKNIHNLFLKPIIIDTKELKNGWLKIDLDDIKIHRMKYLYVGYKTLGEPIATGIIKKNTYPNINAYRRSPNSVTRKWNKLNVFIPAIKIGIKH